MHGYWHADDERLPSSITENSLGFGDVLHASRDKTVLQTNWQGPPVERITLVPWHQYLQRLQEIAMQARRRVINI